MEHTKMDIKQATKSVIDKIHKLEPEIETACKIIGCVLMQDLGEQGMIRLALAPDKFLENLVHRTKIQLGYLSTKAIFPSISPPMATNPLSISEVPLSYIPFSSNGTNRPYLSPATLNPWDPHLTPERLPGYGSEFGSFGYLDPVDNFFEYEDHFPQDLYHLDRGLGNLNMRTTCRSSNFSQKSCHYYFDRGYCRNGSKCQFFHGHENFSTIYGRSDPGNEDHGLAPGSLEKLEYEITELLKSKRGNPVSIASLHTSYYEKYGKILQADGYLTESQRHGRAGYNLTTLLERFKSIRVIERPHGQHFVILAEDALRFKLENRTERNDPGPIVSGSRQIYLTFPAESTFTEEDVSNYFSSFGTVEDVRIPCQQKRMFGFVTFASANTVRTLLDNPNTHFVCGSRVLVKPYRERSKHNERKYTEKYDRGLRNEAPRFIRRQLMEEKEKLEAEMQRMRLSKLQLRFKHAYNQQYIDSSINELSSSSKDPFKLRNGERFSCLLGLINNNSVNDNKLKHSGSDSNSNSTNQDSDEIDLPESPFSTAIRGDISASL